MDRSRPWQTDAELEQESRRGGGFVARLKGSDEKPLATYGLLLSFAAVFVLEWAVFLVFGLEVFQEVFTIHANANRFDWALRPWSPFTATISHNPFGLQHLLFNALTLFFFGPTVERLLGRRRFLWFFAAVGALSSMAQATIDPSTGALGASGALMGLIGLMISLNPHAKIYMFPLPFPIPMWAAGVGFALIDLAGAFNPNSPIGNFAHLGGLALGLAYGQWFKRALAARGQRIVSA